jgi:hypothetical protein
MRKGSVKGVSVYDSIVNENFLTVIKENNKVVVVDKIPSGFDTFAKLKKDITYTPGESVEKLGAITLYYDESLIVKEIEQLKNNTKSEIQKFNSEIDSQQQKSNMMKLVIFLLALVLILIFIIILLRVFVNKPLKVLHSGLQNFFMFLSSVFLLNAKYN